MKNQQEELQESIKVIRERAGFAPTCEMGLVLGSGLGFLADLVEQPLIVPYADLPGFPRSTVDGHAGNLMLGRLEGRQVVLMQGRFHAYEGYPLSQVVMGVRLMGLLGARLMLVTNAAGGIRDGMVPGDLMLIRDHINLLGANPLYGPNDESMGTRFPDLSDAYRQALRTQALGIAAEEGIALAEGVYAACLGPSYETPAEVRMLKTIGADAVGMSTVPEVIAACHMGMEVLGISCISNLAAGISPHPLSHEEVKETAERVQGTLSRLVLLLVRKLQVQALGGA